jgi:hypothetical protein
MKIKFTRVTLYHDEFVLYLPAEEGEDIHDVVERNWHLIATEAEASAVADQVEDYEEVP